jgi:hypothetical protein
MPLFQYIQRPNYSTPRNSTHLVSSDSLSQSRHFRYLTDSVGRYSEATNASPHVTVPLYFLIHSLAINNPLYVISGFRREVVENCTLMGYYAASSDNFLPTIRENLSGPSLGAKDTLTLKMRPKRRQEITITRCVIKQNNAVLILLYAYVL